MRGDSNKDWAARFRYMAQLGKHFAWLCVIMSIGMGAATLALHLVGEGDKAALPLMLLAGFLFLALASWAEAKAADAAARRLGG